MRVLKLDEREVLKLYLSATKPCTTCGRIMAILNREDGSPSYLYCFDCKMKEKQE
jgi:hypothetical protein